MPAGSKVLTLLQTVTQIALEGNTAVSVIFGTIKAIRDAWPRAEGEAVLSDDELRALLKSEFQKNSTRNAQLIDEIVAGN